MAAGSTEKGIGSFAARIGSIHLALLILINLLTSLAIWTGLLASGGKVDLSSSLSLAGTWSGFCRRPWGLLTYMFTQSGLLHLVFNLLWLYFFGRIAMMVLSGRQLLFLYIGGGLAGGILFLLQILIGEGSAPLLGSSAAVMAIISALAVFRPDMTLNLWLFGRVRLIWIAIISVALTFIGAGGGDTGGQMAHIGGLLFGIVSGLMLRSAIDPSAPFEKISYAVSGWRAKRRSNKISRRRRADARLLTGIRGRLYDRERLDELLDKIRASGYTSLTRSERAELNALSNRLSSREEEPE